MSNTLKHFVWIEQHVDFPFGVETTLIYDLFDLNLLLQYILAS